MNKDVIWTPFNLENYVNYERDGYCLLEEIKYESPRYYHPWEDGVRRWIKSDGGSDYTIEELDIWTSVDFLVEYPKKNGFGFGTNRLLHVGVISWRIGKTDDDWIYHRDDGPAIIRINKDQKPWKTEWWVNGVDISQDVRPWIKSMGFPVFYKWTPDQKMAFKLAFR